MVFISKFLLKASKNVFLDSLTLRLKGGHGGNGLGRYGGVGGQGGAVVFIAKEKATLRKILKKYPRGEIRAGDGEHSSKLRIIGRRGPDVMVETPVGVTIISPENGKVFAELNEENATFLGAYGGSGGCVASDWIGKYGQDWKLTLDLKLIADVGLVGFPNAGKSTFLKAISKASPKIASYPFTTIQPNIGIINYPDYRQISVADLPGLIEGAHANIGMGHKFLKHVERTKLLLLICDINGFQLSPKHARRSCLENIFSLMKELEMYNETLMDRPSILLINKMDTEGSSKSYEKLKDQLKHIEETVNDCPEEIRPSKLLEFDKILPMAAKHREGIDKILTEIRRSLDLEAERKLLELEKASVR
ncbi:GTP-binding protein 10 homolog [Culicoides brevitarsis]|uniref:GTP-binding protein 10 homolog n=1 Tax=Culicoides brevitarsis TaxID=469753 RepID=UPI00307B3C7F